MDSDERGPLLIVGVALEGFVSPWKRKKRRKHLKGVARACERYIAAMDEDPTSGSESDRAALASLRDAAKGLMRRTRKG